MIAPKTSQRSSHAASDFDLDRGDAMPEVHVASNVQDVTQAWRLVYQVYRATGLIPTNDYGLHAASRSVSPGTAVFYAPHDDDETSPMLDRASMNLPAATLTAVMDHAAGLPLDAVYGDELDRLRDAGRVLVECGQFAHRRQLTMNNHRSEARLLLKVEGSLRQLMRHAFHFGQTRGANDFLIGVHPRHTRFYSRAFGFAPLAEARSYAMVNDRPVQLMRADLDVIFDLEPRPWALAYSVNSPLSPSLFDKRWMFSELANDPASSTLRAYLNHRNTVAELAA